ncbi:MAG: hypothetical protein A2Y10_10145 [Planctomycetes bacterium GWF2_41_51]|nr:MAG: hypothetical protein A2Y10_10145 [Planctomycetes bacterium GWF2_41_51]HBG27700.1 alpha-mannosidase [Phycisphaerales bacterium]
MDKDKYQKKTEGKQKQRIGHIVSHAHWDREWRYPIWETRLMLVDFMDELIDLLESDVYPGFLLDGQVIPVLDYLEVKPEMADRVKSLVRSGKLEIGPWLILPDEYPVDGEALIRNLLYGNRAAKKLGAVFNVGYTPFGWGQIAQLPQIYAEFGIDVAMIGKRVGKHRAPHCEFLWQAPDGSELLTTRFGELGRQNFYFKIHLSALFNILHEGTGWEYNWSKGGVAYHRADPEQKEQDHFQLDVPTHWHPEYITSEVIEDCWETMRDSLLENDRLMMNGCDYSASQPLFPEMVKRLNEVDKASDREWIHTTMTRYVELMRQKIDRLKLEIVKGELRDGPAGPLTGNALTTSITVKRLNKHAQNMLIRFAEPLCVLASMSGFSFPSQFIEQAWLYLLKSHPHDSINGVTQDKTVRDVINRLEQVVELSQSLGNRAMQDIISKIDLSRFSPDDILIVVFNSMPYARREVVEAWINLPDNSPRNPGWPYEPEGLVLFDVDGNVVPTQWLGRETKTYPVAQLHTRAFPFNCQSHRVFFDTGQLPPAGYKVFRVGLNKDGRTKSGEWSNSQARTSTLLKSPDTIENEFIRIKMNCNGTFDLTDKQHEKTYCNLNYYEDRGEIGDYWINKRPMYDQVHTSLGCSARIWSENSGPLQSTLVSEITMLLPRSGIREQQCRSGELTEMTIQAAVTLKSGQRYAHVDIQFENRHEDHCLRVILPTGLDTAVAADVGGHFAVDSRPIRSQGPAEDSVWPDMATLPQNNFVDVSDGEDGIAFLNDGFTEYEVLDTPERTVAFSLVRSVQNWICTETRVGSVFPSQKGGQSLGRHTARYAIYPHPGNWQDANIPLCAELFNVPTRIIQTRQHNGVLSDNQMSLFEITNSALRFSAIKKTEDHDTYIIRIYNPTKENQQGALKFAVPPSNAWETNLDEERMKEIELTTEYEVPVNAGPQKIVTIEIKPKKQD